MTSAVAGRASQAAMLVAAVGLTSPFAAAAQAAMLVSYTPPNARQEQVSQVGILVATLGVNVSQAEVSQTCLLVAYATGVPDPFRSRAWSFTLDGHTFYVLNLSEEGTFLYDQTTGQWCQFSTQGYGQWNFLNGCMWGDRIIGADILTNQVYELDPTAVLDDGWRDIAHAVTGGISVRSRTYVGCDAVRVSASIGQLDEVNGSQMLLRFSDDQEQTWSDYFTVDLIHDDFDGEIAYRSLGSFMAPGRIFELTDSGGLIRIDGADAFLNGFDNEQQSQDGEG